MMKLPLLRSQTTGVNFTLLLYEYHKPFTFIESSVSKLWVRTQAETKPLQAPTMFADGKNSFTILK